MATGELNEDMAHVRKRPGMYIGSTSASGLYYLLLEVIANAFDEVLSGRGQTIAVTMHADGSVEIADDGAGLGAARPDQEAFLTTMFTRVRFEPTADGHHPHVHLSELAGVGLGVVSALSARVDVEVRSPTTTLRQSYRRGLVAGPVTRVNEPGVASGTTVRVWPDPEIFHPPASVVVGRLHDRLTELARLEPRVRFRFSVEPIAIESEPDLAGLWFVEFGGLGLPAGPAVLRGIDGTDEVQVAVGFGGWGNPRIKGYCNYCEVSEGTSLHDGMNDGLRRIFNESDADLLVSRVQAAIHLKLLEPRWGGPTRARIEDPRAASLIAPTIADHLPGVLMRRPDLQAQIDGVIGQPDS
jgi:DNA gyrase subunit B